MKNLYYTFILCLLLASSMIAQTTFPGINYQAIARDLNGSPLPNQELSIKISLVANADDPTATYTETHQVKTNELGLFTLIVGQGNQEKGTFQNIPWATSEIWMDLSIDEKGRQNYKKISSQKLLAVPYAIHALTANRLSGERDIESLRAEPGVPSNTWSTFGNSKTKEGKDFLGTTDCADLVMITDNAERLRITCAGDVGIDRDLTIGNDLYVKNNVYLNILGGQTIINGPATVENMSPTHLTGTLDVDKSLNVDGITTLNDDLTVTNMASTHLTGSLDVDKTLNVDGTTTLNDDLTVTNMAPTRLSGKLDVDKNLSVNGLTILNNSLTVTGMSPTRLTGKLDVDKNLNVGGTSTLNSTLTVANMAPTNLTGNLKVDKNAEVGGGMLVKGSGFHAGTQGNYNDYVMRVEGGQQGIAIKLNQSKPNRNYNFASFWDSNGNAMGRIEGFQGLQEISRSIAIAIADEPDEDDAEDGNDSKNQAPPSVPQSAQQYFNNDYAVGALSETLDFVEAIVSFGTNLAACIAGVGVVGDCDDIVWSTVEMIVQGVQLGGYILYNELNVGAAFESGGADYAEWIEKADHLENISFGDVVGVKGGLISKEFMDAERFMVISQYPGVIGAMPDRDNEGNYEKVAFMGQVPVKVIGKVTKGDYIIPSGNQDGMAIAVHPDNMLAKDYQRIIGIAWEASDGKRLFSYIRTAVGINSNDLAKTVDRMQLVINQMQQQLQRLSPDYQAHYFNVDGDLNGATTNMTTSAPIQQVALQSMGLSQYSTPEEAISTAMEYAQSQNFDFSQYPYLNEVMEDPSLENVEMMVDHYTKVIGKLQGMMNNIQLGGK